MTPRTTWPRCGRSTSTSPSGRSTTRPGGARGRCPARSATGRSSRKKERSPPQVPDGPADPGTAARPARPGRRRRRSTRAGTAERLLPPPRPPPPGEVFTAAGQTLRRPVMTTAAPARQVWAEDPDTGKRRDLTLEEHRAFWAWAAVEVLRLHRHPHRGTDRTVPPQPRPVPAARHRRAHPAAADRPVQDRHRAAAGDQPRTGRRAQRDHLPDPRQRRRRAAGGRLRLPRTRLEPADAAAVPAPRRRREPADRRPRPSASCSTPRWPAPGSPTPAGKPLRFTPHDFRRIFITDAIMNGMPPHIAQLVAGHRDINTTMGYKAVYPEEVINGHRAFIARRRALRPSEEYRTPTDEEWEEFLGHFERRKVALGDCGRAYGTSCIHEHSCIRCPLLRVDPAQRPRLAEHPRQPARPHRRSPARRLARRSRGPEGQPRRRRGTSSPSSTSSPPAAPPPSTSACPASPTSPAASLPHWHGPACPPSGHDTRHHRRAAPRPRHASEPLRRPPRHHDHESGP